MLADVVQRYALRCHAYCQMTNHYHLAVTTTDANVSRAVQQLNGDYAQWWNWRHKRNGHLFQARFHGQIVQGEAYLLNVCRYIVLNPVRAHMVDSPEQWRWSSYRATVGLTRLPSFLDCDRLLDSISPNDPENATNEFRRSVLMGDASSLRLPRTAIIGDDAFIARILASRAHVSTEVPRREGRRTLSTIFDGAVTRGRRNAAIVTAFRERYSLAEIARFLDVHRTTVSRIVANRCQTVQNV
jgi:REP element-mobilizing transposase RayT